MSDPIPAEAEITSQGQSFSGISLTDSGIHAHLTPSPEAQAAEVAAAEAQANQTVGAVVPDGFTPEQMAALEAAGYTAPAPATEAAPAVAAPPVLPEGVTPEQLAALGWAAPGGIPAPAVEAAAPVATMEALTPYMREFAATGEVGAESRAAIASAYNVDDATITIIMEGLIARNAAAGRAELSGLGYSEQDFLSWEGWSSEHDSPGTREARLGLLASPDANVRAQAIHALKHAFDTANGPGEPALIRGGPGAKSAETFDQLIQRAVNNPLWEKIGPAGDTYRAEMNAQLGRA